MLLDIVNLSTLQTRAQQRFDKQGWHAAKSEAWKYTSLDALASNAPKPANDASGSVTLPDNISWPHCRLIFQGGIFRQDLCDELPSGVQLVALGDDARALTDIDRLGATGTLVSSLSVAQMTAGISLSIAPGAVIDKPLIFHFVGGIAGAASHPVIYIEIGDEAGVAIAEHHETNSGFSEEYLEWLYRPIMTKIGWSWNSNGLDKMVNLHWLINFILLWYFLFFVGKSKLVN